MYGGEEIWVWVDACVDGYGCVTARFNGHVRAHGCVHGCVCKRVSVCVLCVYVSMCVCVYVCNGCMSACVHV